MTIHRHGMSNTRLSQLSSVSRCASVDSVSNLGGSSSRTQSSTSLNSMLSSLTTTPDYSPLLIQTEVGDLLNIDDLELLGADIIDDDDEDDEEEDDSQNVDNGKNQINEEDGYDSDRDSMCGEYSGRGTSDCTDTTDTERSSSIDELLCGFSTNNESESRYDATRYDYHEKWFICLIGLPACGKSTVVRQLINFTNINTATENNPGVRMKSFNAGDVRRKHEIGLRKKMKFDLSDNHTQQVREQYAFESLKRLTDSLVNDTVDVGILDATNTTKARRDSIFKQVTKVSRESHVEIHTLILEVKCTNKSLRRYNIDQKANNADYKGVPKDQAIIDFLSRIEKYENIYEKVTFKEINRLGAKYFSIINAGECVCYDCGLVHHDSKRHQHLTFKNVALNLIYDFLMNYRCLYAIPYLKQVEVFYTKGHYKPVRTAHSSSTSLKDTLSITMTSISSSSSLASATPAPSIPESSITPTSKGTLLKVLSTPRLC
ncbi:hypothetical protein FOA43_000995 [Brettanomyces nanus]|uniref:6-phosphofructo-2-kinase domain-containing protein n=1 Tax=Eeniella nana TaxID=13502 RepID=A0A875S0P1_EENNA|nr:uncharacterized protein FOA43_000995 [Brettanomyces nanus]QPG73682.1 hypothetical protein FOA43_000995 [Brettanomyces nanus]